MSLSPGSVVCNAPPPPRTVPPQGVVVRLRVFQRRLNHAEGDGEDEEAFEKRLAALKGKRGTPSRSNSNSSGGGDDALTPYQQLKQNQAEQKDRKKTGARALCRCGLAQQHHHKPFAYACHATCDVPQVNTEPALSRLP